MHLHILFPVQDWNADVLLIHAKTNKFCQLAYDMLVSSFPFCFIFCEHKSSCDGIGTLPIFHLQDGCSICSSNFVQLSKSHSTWYRRIGQDNIRKGDSSKFLYSQCSSFSDACCLFYIAEFGTKESKRMEWNE